MKIQPYRSNEEHTVLTALIVNDAVLSAVASKLGTDAKPFANRWANVVAHWCFAYFHRYQRAPGRHIRHLFLRFAQRVKDQEAVDLIEHYLSHLSEEHDRSHEQNEKYLIDLASAYFERVRLQQLAEQVQLGVESNDLEVAREALGNYERLDFSSKAWVDPFQPEPIKQTFRRMQEHESVVQFNGALGQFLSPYLERSGFISFCGPDKRGKSFWLQEVAYRAFRQKRRVLYYLFGDMSEEEIRKRLYCRVLKRPWTTEVLEVPFKLYPEGRTVRRLFREEEREGISVKDVEYAAERLRTIMGLRELRLRIRCDGGMTVPASAIEQEVKKLRAQGWVPDLVVVDYADLLEPEPETKRLDVRHQINLTWLILRRIALDNHCLVTTATQTAATAYNAWLIHKRDFSEDKRKNAHVTGMVGINQTDGAGRDDGEEEVLGEKEQGIYRLNWIVLRGGKWAENQVVWTAGNLALSNPCIISAFPKSGKKMPKRSDTEDNSDDSEAQTLRKQKQKHKERFGR